MRLTGPTIWLWEGEIRTVFYQKSQLPGRLSGKQMPSLKRILHFYPTDLVKAETAIPIRVRCIEVDMYPYSR